MDAITKSFKIVESEEETIREVLRFPRDLPSCPVCGGQEWLGPMPGPVFNLLFSTKARITTWACPHCGYMLEFAPLEVLTEIKQTK